MTESMKYYESIRRKYPEAVSKDQFYQIAHNRLDADAAVKSVLEQFSPERVRYVLANTIQQKDFDGRIPQPLKEWAKSIDVCPENASRFLVDKPNPGLTALFVDAFRQQTEPQKEATSEKTEERDPEVVAWESDEITSIEVKTVEVKTPFAPLPEEAAKAPKAHRLTAEEKEIKAAVMDTLKGQIAYHNDGMRASYRSSNHSFNLLARNGVRIEGNTVTQNGEPLFKIHRRHATRKTQGCYVKEIDSGLESLQHEVGGCIEAIYPYEDPVALVCNEEGKLEGLPLNRALRDEDGDIYDVVAGTFMVVGLTDDSFGSLTVEQMQKFSDLFKVPEQFVKLGDKIVAIPMISKEQQKQESIEQKDFEMNADTSGLTVAGHIGTWHTIDQHEVGGHSFYLMEHDTYGDEAACIIVDERGKLVLDDVYNGFDDDTLRLLDLEVKEVPEMPDPAISVQDMKDYGYAWAGVLPAGQEAAEKALEKGCEVYRLYSDNTEGLCVDAKEIADHAAKGGMLGISKESWMAALEKENYLKAAEMSMEDDYGMIDGIINNGPKEDKTAEVKAPERGEKSSIMDRLKSAKAEKQKECCPPKKHKGEIEL